MKKRLIAGDRPTGKLHIGHYVGTLRLRTLLQDQYEIYVLIADAQALTDNFDDPQKLKESVFELMLDYLACGLDPEKVTIGLQSGLPQIPELTGFLSNLVSMGAVVRNPTVKEEIRQKGMGDEVPFGFIGYPVSQAADILVFNSNLVSGGDDQVPIIELTREISRKFNRIYSSVFNEPEYLKGDNGRLPGTDGAAKMGKSLGNVIYLSDEDKDIRKKVKGMFTDPNRLRATDPGEVDGNPVFVYLDAFKHQCNAEGLVDELKQRYREGTVGDVEVKEHLADMLVSVISPIRERRKQLSNDPERIKEILKKGTIKLASEADKTMRRVRKSIGLYDVS